MTTATIETPQRRNRPRVFIIAVALLAGWIGLAGISYAAFIRTATGTITVTTTGPNSTGLSLFCSAKTSDSSNCVYNAVAPFDDTGQTRSVVLLVPNTLTPVTGAQDVYTKYRLISADVDQGNPCAGFFSFTGPPAALPGGNGVTFRNIGSGADKPLTLNSGPAYTGSNGTTTGDVRTAQKGDANGGQQYLLTLDANAPASCANQSVPLNVSLELIP